MENPVKDPEDWTTGDEPMTGPQRSYLQTLCREDKEEFNERPKQDAEKPPTSVSAVCASSR